MRYFYKILILLLITVSILTGCKEVNRTSFYDYYTNRQDFFSKIIEEKETNRTAKDILLREVAYNKSLHILLSKEYLKEGKMEESIKSIEKYVRYGGDTKYIELDSYPSSIKENILKWEREYSLEITKLKELKMALDSIRYRDQITRKNVHLLSPNIDINILQTRYDSINRKQLYELMDSILSNYHLISSNSQHPHAITSHIAHYTKDDNYFFLNKMIQYAQQEKCDWSLPLSTLTFLSTIFPYARESDSKCSELPRIYLDKNERIDVKKSYLQLIAMLEALTNQPRMRVEIYPRGGLNKSKIDFNLNLIKQFLVDNGIDKSRIVIKYKEQCSNQKVNIDSALFGWRIYIDN